MAEGSPLMPIHLRRVLRVRHLRRHLTAGDALQAQYEGSAAVSVEKSIKCKSVYQQAEQLPLPGQAPETATFVWWTRSSSRAALLYVFLVKDSGVTVHCLSLLGTLS